MLKCTSNVHVFWKDVLESWLFVNSKDLENVNLTQSEILSTPVWFNSYITVNKKSIFIKELYEKGVKIIDDFLDNNGSFYAREYFVEEYDINYMCFMKYNGITCAVATFLKGTHFSRENFLKLQRPFLPMLYRIPILNNKCTKPIYSNINTDIVNPTAFSKWNDEMRLKGHPEVEFKDVFKICFKISKNTSIQWLQYRILYRIVPVKYYLKKSKY